VAAGAETLNLCANNYLGLADHPALVEAAKEALDRWGYGLASVRFICGTQEIHKELEAGISAFLGAEDTILYSSCFDANGGLFETILGEEDAVISDELNHASIIDGIRLCKAQRFRYHNRDMADLEQQLQAASGARFPAIMQDRVGAPTAPPQGGSRPSMASDEKNIRRTLHFKFTVPGASEQMIAMIKSAAPLYQMFGDAQVRLLQNVDDPGRFLQSIRRTETWRDRQQIASDPASRPISWAGERFPADRIEL
jgi:hypothetical protein